LGHGSAGIRIRKAAKTPKGQDLAKNFGGPRVEADTARRADTFGVSTVKARDNALQDLARS
jgi:hypothetical protein